MNLTILKGNICHDINYSYRTNGVPFANFTIAHNKKRKDKSDMATFVNCVAYDKLADIVNKLCAKGTQVCVAGELFQNNWTDKNGNKHQELKILVNTVDVLRNFKEESSQPNTQPEDDLYDDDIPF